MNEITKFIWYGSSESYMELDGGAKTIRINMSKNDMEEWAEDLNIEFVDYPKQRMEKLKIK